MKLVARHPSRSSTRAGSLLIVLAGLAGCTGSSQQDASRVDSRLDDTTRPDVTDEGPADAPGTDLPLADALDAQGDTALDGIVDRPSDGAPGDLAAEADTRDASPDTRDASPDTLACTYADGSAAMPAFSLVDVNPGSRTAMRMVSPRDYLGQVSAWFFGRAT
jgi:hypothetical protein